MSPAQPPHSPHLTTPAAPRRARSGKVIVFGGLCGAPAPGRPPPSSPAGRTALAAAQRNGFGVVATPAPVRGLAAGQQHLVMTDGERVWLVGRWLDAAGHEAGVAPFYAPHEVLALPAEGVSKVVAGAHSTGVVSGDGRLFLGGRLLDRHHAEAVRRGAAGRRHGWVVTFWAGPARLRLAADGRRARLSLAPRPSSLPPSPRRRS
jgi:hypothetical protein